MGEYRTTFVEKTVDQLYTLEQESIHQVAEKLIRVIEGLPEASVDQSAHFPVGNVIVESDAVINQRVSVYRTDLNSVQICLYLNDTVWQTILSKLSIDPQVKKSLLELPQRMG